MSDRRLRSALIRLAAASTPEVRKALLPLLSKTAAPKTAKMSDFPAVEKQVQALVNLQFHMEKLAKEVRSEYPESGLYRGYEECAKDARLLAIKIGSYGEVHRNLTTLPRP